jgi:hypothetical protein
MSALGSKADLAPNLADVGSAPHNGHQFRASNVMEYLLSRLAAIMRRRDLIYGDNSPLCLTRALFGLSQSFLIHEAAVLG